MEGKSNYSQVTKVLGDTTLFYIERSLDQEIVVYDANRKGNILSHPFVDVYWTNTGMLSKREPVSKKAKELFFGVQVKKEGTKYKMFISAIPNKIITLHLKKSGKVVAKTIISGKESKIHKIYVNIDSSSALGIPVVTHLKVYGEHKKQIVSENIEITEDVRNRFDVSSFLPNIGDFSGVF